MKRRDFVRGLAGSTSLVAVQSRVMGTQSQEWIDCNATWGNWPFRRSPLESPTALATMFSERSVTDAWVANAGSIFRQDIREENAALVEACRTDDKKILRPIGTLNPAAEDWLEDLRFCQRKWGMSIYRLFPNYHGYDLDSPGWIRLMEIAAEENLALQIMVQWEDERTQYARMQVAPVKLEPLGQQLKAFKNMPRLMILNATRPQLTPILSFPSVLIDIAKLEGVGAIESLLADLAHERVVFGSHAPFFYWEAARMKLQESELLDRQLDSILRTNAARWLNS